MILVVLLIYRKRADLVMNVTQLIRLFLMVIACGLIVGCASDDPLSTSTDNHAPVAGESTPPPATGARGGWAW